MHPFKPRCPNHNEPLEDCGFPLPAKGSGTCPVSGALFDFEVETDVTKVKNVVDTAGNVKKVAPYKVSGED